MGRKGRTVAPRALRRPRPVAAPDNPVERQHGARDPNHPNKVWCCDARGWVTPTEAFDHVWDTFSGSGD